MSARRNIRSDNAAPFSPGDPSPALKFSVACLVCSLASLIIGYAVWIFLGNHVPDAPPEQPIVTKSAERPSTPTPTPAPLKLAPAGELPVPGGEIALGGEDTGRPLRRAVVEPFRVAETEVTNHQYADFVRETGHRAPEGWAGEEYQPGTAVEPVTGVTWQDADDYCAWLSKKIGARVSLPTEAEWESAARGQESRKYPWGESWNDRAAASKEKGGRVRAVKSYPEGRSPFGAYDMAGNVWEWTSDQALDGEGKPLVKGEVPLRIIKGGAADETAALLVASSRKEVPANLAFRSLGFRYILRRP